LKSQYVQCFWAKVGRFVKLKRILIWRAITHVPFLCGKCRCELNTAVGTWTRVWDERPSKCGSIPGRGKILSLFESVQNAPGTQRTSHSRVSEASFFPRAQNGRIAKVKPTHLHAVPRLRIRPHLPPPPPPMCTQTIFLYLLTYFMVQSPS